MCRRSLLIADKSERILGGIWKFASAVSAAGKQLLDGGEKSCPLFLAGVYPVPGLKEGNIFEGLIWVDV